MLITFFQLQIMMQTLLVQRELTKQSYYLKNNT